MIYCVAVKMGMKETDCDRTAGRRKERQIKKRKPTQNTIIVVFRLKWARLPACFLWPLFLWLFCWGAVVEGIRRYLSVTSLLCLAVFVLNLPMLFKNAKHYRSMQKRLREETAQTE